MEMDLVKVTDKGQISIPVKMQRKAGIKKGDKILLVCDKKRIIIERVDEKMYRHLLKHSEGVAQKIWGSKADEVWDKV